MQGAEEHVLASGPCGITGHRDPWPRHAPQNCLATLPVPGHPGRVKGVCVALALDLLAPLGSADHLQHLGP
eukprot:7829144-Lingulodinium_polyedra.AAC.1